MINTRRRGECTQQAVCTRCGTAYGDLDPNDHDWGEWRVTKQATTSAEGEKKRVCQRNKSHTETRAIPSSRPRRPAAGAAAKSGKRRRQEGKEYADHYRPRQRGDTRACFGKRQRQHGGGQEIKSAELDKIGTDSAVVIDLSGLNKA